VYITLSLKEQELPETVGRWNAMAAAAGDDGSWNDPHPHPLASHLHPHSHPHPDPPLLPDPPLATFLPIAMAADGFNWKM